MELTQEDVLQILKLLEASNVDYLEVALGDMRLVASKSGVLPAQGPTAAATASAVPPPAAPAQAAPAVAAVPAVPDLPVASRAPAAAAATAVDQTPGDGADIAADEGLVPVTAPVVGVFYGAPEPGAPAFVEVGSRVDAGATMGLVEVMKMFNSVTAGVAGEVVRVLVSNDEFVEFGQPLFLLRPETA